MSIDFLNEGVRSRMFSGEFGLERETLRVDEKGNIAHTKHPFGDDPRISRDFCENQIELITGVHKTAKGAVEELSELHRQVTRRLMSLDSGREYVWHFSNPPRIKGEDDIPVAEFEGAQKQKSLYREYLARKYGKKKMLFSGIHCNFSFSDELVKESFKMSGADDLREYRDRLYLELAKKLVRYSWLIVYLTAASPVTDSSFLDYDSVGRKYASARCSEIGYWNDFVPILSYEGLREYVESIQRYVDEGRIIAASELYYPIRLKPRGENTLENLLDRGVNHIELRMLDLNPLTPVGIFTEDVEFIELLILYLMSLEEDDLTEKEQTDAIGLMKKAAEFDPEGIREAALGVINNMERFFTDISAPEKVAELLDCQRKKLTSARRYAEVVRGSFETDYAEKGLALSKKYAEQ